MTDPLNRIAQARDKARRARARLGDNAALLREHTQPAALAGHAARKAVAQAKRRPLVTAAAAATLGLALAIPGARRAGAALGRGLWHDREIIGRLMIAALAATRRLDRKDRMK